MGTEVESGQVTRASDVVLPVVVVALEHLRTTSGEPVRVRCERIDELVLLEAIGPPGSTPPKVGGEAPQDPLELARALNTVAPALIEAGTALDDGAGGFVRPAFYFDEAKPRHPQSIPGRLLRAADVAALVQGIMLAGGYLGGAAESGAFPDGQRAGDGVGVGAAPAGEVRG